MLGDSLQRSDRPLNICILGATGSIGGSTLDVIARHPGRFFAHTLTAHRQVDAMLVLAKQCLPKRIVMADPEAARQLRARLADGRLSVDVLDGADGLIEAVSDPEVDAVMAAIVGAAGLPASIAAARLGKRLLLANKESLVMAGPVFLEAVRAGGATLLPIDSEHNAIFQCLPPPRGMGPPLDGVRKIILTASGGPFRKWSAEQIAAATPEQAVAHPKWVMGRKISVDSASLMNKGLEVIEARFLFGIAPENLQVLVHPQSVVHSMVEYVDGSTLAQLGSPDMRTPIAHAMAWPERIDAGVKPLRLDEVATLAFEAPDEARFPCLALARQAMSAGDAAPAILNAANEVAVEAFLERRIPFSAIPQAVAFGLDQIQNGSMNHLDEVLAFDARTRECVKEFIRRKSV